MQKTAYSMRISDWSSDVCSSDLERGGFRHDALVAFFLDLFGHLIVEGIGLRAGDGLEAEGADAVELRFVEPVEEILEITLGFAGEADDEARADRDVGGDGAPVLEALKHLGFVRRALHALEDAWARVLAGDVEIGREQPLRHPRDDRVDVRIGDRKSVV